jgi:hypothetical protein
MGYMNRSIGAAYAFRGIAQMIFTSTHLLKLALVWILIEGIPAVHFRNRSFPLWATADLYYKPIYLQLNCRAVF